MPKRSFRSASPMLITRRSLIGAVAASLAASKEARAQFAGPKRLLLGNPNNGPYWGQVATRCFLPGQNFGIVGGIYNARTAHIARDNISWIQGCWPNFYCDPAVGEVGSGGTFSTTASIEYPAGTFHQLLFDGSASGSATGSLLFSDPLQVSIPTGSQFWSRSNQSNTADCWPASSAARY